MSYAMRFCITIFRHESNSLVAVPALFITVLFSLDQAKSSQNNECNREIHLIQASIVS